MDPMDNRAGYMDPEYRWHLDGYNRNEYPHPHLPPHLPPRTHPHPHSHPQTIPEAVLREIEKERIREEIIVSETVRRRVLEAEVRRELMMEREMALRQGSYGFPFGSSPLVGSESPMRPSHLLTKAEWSAEERLGMALADTEKLKRSENGGLETLPFQRGTADPRTSDVKPALECNKEKERILLLTKPNENISGSKTKDVTTPELVNIELLGGVIANKKSKEEWGCALCQVMTPSEKHLNEHVIGSKHQSKVAALRAQRTGKNYSIGLFPKKATKSILVEEKRVKPKAQSLSSKKAGEATSEKDNLKLSRKPKSEHLKKTQAEVIGKVQKKSTEHLKKVKKNESDPRKNSKEWWSCALCQVMATSEKDLTAHVLGKKHELKVAELRAQTTARNYSINVFAEKPAKSIYMEKEGVELKAQSLFSEKAGEATSKKDDLPLLENPKSEHLKETKAEVVQRVQKNEDDLRKKVQKNENDLMKKGCEFWCELYQVGTLSSEVMNAHKMGKKHVSRLRRCEQEGGTGSFNQKKSDVLVDPVEDVSGNGKNIKFGEFNLALDEVSSENHMLKAMVDQEERQGKTLYSEVVNIVLPEVVDFELHADVIASKKSEEWGSALCQENEERERRTLDSEVVNIELPKVVNNELPADVTANKKSKEEWSCALCQVSVTSEKGLNDHVLGKKHKSKEAALRS